MHPKNQKIFRGPRQALVRFLDYSILTKDHFYKIVPKTGLEPARLSTLAPETSASTNSAIWASSEYACEKEMRFAHLGCRHSSS